MSKLGSILLALALSLGVLNVNHVNQSAEGSTNPIVFLGTGGITWSSVETVLNDYPDESWAQAWRKYLDRSVLANNVPRSVAKVSCPADGWMILSAGQRVAYFPNGSLIECNPIPAIIGNPAAWDSLQEAAGKRPLGALGASLKAGGVKAAALGRGAAIALALPDGKLAGDYFPALADNAELAQNIANMTKKYQLTIVDVGAVSRPPQPTGPPALLEVTDTPPEDDNEGVPPVEVEIPPLPDETEPMEALSLVRRIGYILEALPLHARVMLVSLSDGPKTAQLQMATWAGPRLPHGWGTSTSVRHPALTQTPDYQVTLLDWLGLAPAPHTTGGLLQATPADATLLPLRQDRAHARALVFMLPWFYWIAVGLGLVLFLFALVVRLTRGSGAAVLRPAGFTLAGFVIAAEASNYFPWWKLSSPLLLGLILLGAGALIGVGAEAAERAARRRWGNPARGMGAWLLSGILAVLIYVDALRGGVNQLDSLLGTSSLLGARFYGMNNTAFTLGGTAALIVTALTAQWITARGARIAWVAGVGLAVTVIDGAPSWGADFGGPPALLPAFLVLLALLEGVRISWQRVLGVVGITVVTVGALGVADWLRPPASRTHLGRFVDSLLKGEAGPIISRKIGQNISNLVGSNMTILAIVGILVIIVTVRELRRQKALTPDAFTSPTLRALAWALGVFWVIGYFLNDSGIVIPAMGMLVAIPLALAYLAGLFQARYTEPGSCAAAARA